MKKVRGQKDTVAKDGVRVGSRARINFVGTGVTVTDDPESDETDVTISGTEPALHGDEEHTNPLSDHTGDATDAHDASAISVLDTAGHFDAADVETALAEAYDDFEAHGVAADPHGGYRLESADHSHQTTGAEAGTLDHGAALTGLTDDDHAQYLKEKATGGTAAETPEHDHSAADEAGTVAHSATTGQTTDDHHAEVHDESAHAGVGTSVIVRLSSDHTFDQDSTTLQDITGLEVPVGAGESWFIESILDVDGSAAADVKFAWDVPANTTGRWGGMGTGNATNVPGWGTQAAGTTVGGLLALATERGYGAAGAGTPNGLSIGARVVTTDTGGTVTLQGAQNTAEASDTKVLTGAFLRATRLA